MLTDDSATASPPAPGTDTHTPLVRPYSRLVVWLVIALAGLIMGLWMLGTPPSVHGKADAVGYAVCHRIPARSFKINGRPLPLCARCTGIYLGVMTGLALYGASGRMRASRLPRLRILAVLALFGVAIAVDGLNSYFSLFEAYTPIYPPHNRLRLITGMYAGLTMVTLVLPVFNTTVWHTPHSETPLRGFKELATLCLIAALVIIAVWVQRPVFLFLFGLISVAGVVFMFGVIGSVLFLTVTRRENRATGWHDLALPALAGLTFAWGVIGMIDLGRYLLTGTWEGFTLVG